MFEAEVAKAAGVWSDGSWRKEVGDGEDVEEESDESSISMLSDVLASDGEVGSCLM